jgi:hypothetical protein
MRGWILAGGGARPEGEEHQEQAPHARILVLLSPSRAPVDDLVAAV